ncbi:MAG: hypothetical protein HUU28_04855 [Planctomycetaceae bacterium]|nr:hypothetical protein [Planctomycetaceae bacterium]
MNPSKLALFALSALALGSIVFWRTNRGAPSPLVSAEPLAGPETAAKITSKDSATAADRVAASARGEIETDSSKGAAPEPATPAVPEPKPISIAWPLMKFGDLETVLRDARLNPNGVTPNSNQRARLAELLPTLNREAQVLFSDLSDEVDRRAQQKVQEGQFETQPLGRNTGGTADRDGVVVKIGGIDHQKVVIVREGDSTELDLNLTQQRELWLRGKEAIASILASP